jgi:Transposase zinc-binding domain
LGIGWRRGHRRLRRAARAAGSGGRRLGPLGSGTAVLVVAAGGGGVRAREVGEREGGGGYTMFVRRPGGCGRPRSSVPAITRMSNPNMFRPKLEVGDIFRRHGEAWRLANAGHVNLTQRRVMTAIEICGTAALGGHVDRCQDCAHTRIAYNSCLMGRSSNGERAAT